MGAISLPPVPYDATAVRPDWADLPAALRAAIAQRMGAPVTAVTSAGGGFTRGFAAVVETAAGDCAFVKAARLFDQAHVADWYAREAAITAALPDAVPAPRPRWTMTAAEHFVICLEAVDGRMPALPWRPAELGAALAAWATAARALAEPPAGLVALGLPALADIVRSDLSIWQAVAVGREPMPPAPAAAAEHLDELAALEAALPRYAEGDTRVLHCDLRLDNILIERSGAAAAMYGPTSTGPAFTGRAGPVGQGGNAWICDWNWLCTGPPWFDTAALLVTAYASGLDADALFAAHPTARDAPPDGLDAALAALAGYWFDRAAAGPTDASPHVRPHQRWSGEVSLAWLAHRRDWT
jgi:hypothetical protein